MCNISSTYFIKNGTIDYACTPIDPQDDLKALAIVTFNAAEQGQQYKAELKINLPTGDAFSFFTPYRTVGQFATFISDSFIRPIPPGTYVIIWVAVYDINGNTICSGCPGC